MEFRSGGTIATLRATVTKVREQNLTFLAGSLAYNAFVSLIPLLLLVLLVAGTIGDETLTARISDLTQAFLTPNAQNLIGDALTNTSGQTGVSVVGVLVLLWGALKLFRGLNTAFAEVYTATDDTTFIGQIRNGLIAFGAVAVSLLAVGFAGGAFAYFDHPLLHVLNPVFLLAGLTLAFLPMYYVFPGTELTIKEALPGAVVAAGGWALLEVGFQVYAANAGKYEAYGVIGGVLLLITWLYFSGLVLLVGAAINAVIWERSRPDRMSEAVESTELADESDGQYSRSELTSLEFHLAAEGMLPEDEQLPGHDTAPSFQRAGAATMGVAAVAPMGTRRPPARTQWTSKSRRGSPRSQQTASRSFLVGVAVGALGSVALMVTSLWRLLD